MLGLYELGLIMCHKYLRFLGDYVMMSWMTRGRSIHPSALVLTWSVQCEYILLMSSLSRWIRHINFSSSIFFFFLLTETNAIKLIDEIVKTKRMEQGKILRPRPGLVKLQLKQDHDMFSHRKSNCCDRKDGNTEDQKKTESFTTPATQVSLNWEVDPIPSMCLGQWWLVNAMLGE